MYKVYDNEFYTLDSKTYVFESISEAIEMAQWLQEEEESHGDSFHYFFVRNLETGCDVY